MKIKKFDQLSEELIDENEHRHHVDLITNSLFDIQDNFHKLSNNQILLRALKNDLLGIVDRYNLKD